MSTSHDHDRSAEWWTEFGLAMSGLRKGSWHAPTIREEITKALAEYRPVGFTSQESGALVSLEALIAKLGEVADDVERRATQSESDKSELRRIEVSERIEADRGGAHRTRRA